MHLDRQAVYIPSFVLHFNLLLDSYIMTISITMYIVIVTFLHYEKTDEVFDFANGIVDFIAKIKSITNIR